MRTIQTISIALNAVQSLKTARCASAASLQQASGTLTALDAGKRMKECAVYSENPTWENKYSDLALAERDGQPTAILPDALKKLGFHALDNDRNVGVFHDCEHMPFCGSGVSTEAIRQVAVNHLKVYHSEVYRDNWEEIDG
jgi:hypothetical protein